MSNEAQIRQHPMEIMVVGTGREVAMTWKSVPGGWPSIMLNSMSGCFIASLKCALIVWSRLWVFTGRFCTFLLVRYYWSVFVKTERKKGGSRKRCFCNVAVDEAKQINGHRSVMMRWIWVVLQPCWNVHTAIGPRAVWALEVVSWHQKGS